MHKGDYKWLQKNKLTMHGKKLKRSAGGVLTHGDPYGNVIRKSSYGTHGQYGWELDHNKPKSRGGKNADRNIQPIHWEENLKKSDKYPYKKKH